MRRTSESSRKAQGRTGAGTGRPLTLVFGLSLTAGLGAGTVDSRTGEAGGHQSRERHLVTQAAPHFRDALFYVPNDREATIAFWNERRALHLQQAPADRTPPESPYDRFMRFGYDETG